MHNFPNFYNQSLRKYIVAFGNMFNGMVVQRLDSSGTTVQTIAVPISYAPKEKWLARKTLDPNLDRPIAVQYPNLAFEITNISYDGNRKLPATTRIKLNSSSAGSTPNVYAPVPWNIHFALYIFVRNADDAAQIMEQILPFFGPEWTNAINLLPDLGSTGVFDIPTVIDGDVSIEDVYEGDFFTRRALIYTINFTMKGYFFGPVNTRGSRSNVIKKIQLDFIVPSSNSSTITAYDIAHDGRSERIIIRPGLTANGQPTTNSSASISYQLISANSNYGIASNTFHYDDGRRWDPVTDTDE